MTSAKREDSHPARSTSEPTPKPTRDTPRSEATPETGERKLKPERRLNGRAIWWPSR